MKDLSELAAKSLAGAGSMSATNTVSVPPQFAPPGSASESVSPDDVRPEPDHTPAGNATGDYRQTHPDGHPAANPFTVDGGGPWKASH